MDSSLLIGVLIALGLLFWWAKGAWAEAEERRREREDGCPHNPEWQDTIRVNKHPYNAFIPGFRWAQKKCRGCGRTKNLYSPSLKPWDEYVAEFNRETLDRKTEFAAREREHKLTLDHERRQQEKRERLGTSEDGD